MKEKQDKKLEKWTGEIAVLETLHKHITGFNKLKEEKGDKDKLDKINAKIANLIEDNSWTRLEWSVIKRGKASRVEGLEKIEAKIKERNKKIEAQKTDEGKEDSRDWTAEREAVTEGSKFYNYIYGELEVLAVEEEYLYLKIIDKKGVRDGWLTKNNAAVTTIEGVEDVKEFPRTAIGRSLFPDAKAVASIQGAEGHKMFK